MYFIGYQGEKVIFLDPHLCQPSVNIYSTNDDKTSVLFSPSETNLDSFSLPSNVPLSDNELFENKSFHCANAGRILFTKLDPSIAIGFYIKSLNELNSFCDLVKKVQILKNIAL